ncbi:serum amyloid P-component-like [Sardina pilchardus]|uniref:serum amyloid P-component-like n=1 Tax=Sardina pilchardus TaxID=27697 RepID=UPI002E0E0B93
MSQIYKDRLMSVRKGMSRSQKFSGTPVVTLSDFEGQVTDIHVWNKTLPLSDLRAYYQGHSYPSGNLLSWWDISYTSQGYAVLQDAYPIGGATEKEHTGKEQRRKHGQRSKCRPGGSRQ